MKQDQLTSITKFLSGFRSPIKYRAWNNIEKKWCDNRSWYLHHGTFKPYWIGIKQEADLTITNSTFLEDKNGNELFELDLVKLRHKGKPAICYIMKHMKGYYCLKWVDGYINNHPLVPENYEKVGNLFENAELFLEQKQY
jgi:hypothetical protein